MYTSTVFQLNLGSARVPRTCFERMCFDVARRSFSRHRRYLFARDFAVASSARRRSAKARYTFPMARDRNFIAAFTNAEQSNDLIETGKIVPMLSVEDYDGTRKKRLPG